MSRGTAAAQEVRELQLIIVALRADLDRANSQLNRQTASVERLAREHNVAIERMRIAEFRESELQRDVEAMGKVVEAARVLMATPDPADLSVISAAGVGLNAALNNLDKP